jgi:hypothetical protein
MLELSTIPELHLAQKSISIYRDPKSLQQLEEFNTTCCGESELEIVQGHQACASGY